MEFETPSLYVLAVDEELVSDLQSIGFTQISSVEEVPDKSHLNAIVMDVEHGKHADISWIRRAYPTSFISIFDPTAIDRPHMRLAAFDAGANQVAYDILSVRQVITQSVLPSPINSSFPSKQRYTCPLCRLENLTEDDLWRHLPAYHINMPNDLQINMSCPVCQKRLKREPLQVHIHEQHGPVARTEIEKPIHNTQLYNFSLVVCRHPVTEKFLLCQGDLLPL